MAGNKSTPKKSTPRSTAPKQAPSKKAPPTKSAPKKGGISKEWWITIGVVVVLIVVGIIVQTNRSESENTKVVTPKHAMGPNDSEIEGDASAPVLVQEYADFQCPTCRLFHEDVGATVNQLVEDGKIRFAYTYYPFLGEESVRAAAAAVCAGDQGKFFPYADVLYNNQAAENSGFLTTDQLVEFGKDAGITGSAFTKFEQCVRVDTYEGFALRQAENTSKRGISGTPTLLVTGPNGKTIQLTTEQALTPALLKQAVADSAAGKT